MTIRTAATVPTTPPQPAKALPITLEAGTIIWSTAGIPVAEITCQLYKYRVNWFAPQDGDQTLFRALALQELEAVPVLP